MKFGIFCEIPVPRPWTATAERQAYLDALEHVRFADRAGFDQVWAVEHHFLEEYSHCSAPDLFLTACAMQTDRIRIGRGIAVCVPEINGAVQLAERAAALDLLSGGRLEFGTGRSATWAELGGFHADVDRTKLTWDEYVRVIPQMWVNERFAYEGTYVSLPERAVLPKPIQKPHPPMWVAVSSPGTELDAADRGLGSLGLTFGGYAETEGRISRYRTRIQSCEPAGEFVNEQVCTVNYLYCHEDNEAAQAVGLRLAGAFAYSAAQVVSAKEIYAGQSYSSAGLLAQIRTSDAPGHSAKVPEGVTVGDPDHIAETIKTWESIGVDRINFLVQTAAGIPQGDVMKSLDLFSCAVMPRFS
jgi:alkanesulfonate monooxygenase SsuD/methylene tetrahydromethanopterin reductase-like flavin-dependent oxidoreductase (luciferase family)